VPRLALIFLFWFFASAQAAAQTAPRTLVLAPLPIEKPELVKRLWKPFSAHLEKTAGVTLRIEHFASFDTVLAEFRAGRIDLAVLGPLPYLALQDTLQGSHVQAEPLVVFREKDGQATLRCALATPASERLAVREIKGKKIALAQPQCTCCWFAGELLLRAAGSALGQNRFRYLGNHHEAALAVLRGEFDAGVMLASVAREYAGLGLTVIAETPSFPGFSLVANAATVSPEQRARIRQALLSASAEDRAHWSAYTRHGAALATEDDFAALRKLRAGIGNPPAQGNF
jgi:phosphonate transport system substrate-binding protein